MHFCQATAARVKFLPSSELDFLLFQFFPHRTIRVHRRPLRIFLTAQWLHNTTVSLILPSTIPIGTISISTPQMIQIAQRLKISTVQFIVLSLRPILGVGQTSQDQKPIQTRIDVANPLLPPLESTLLLGDPDLSPPPKPLAPPALLLQTDLSTPEFSLYPHTQNKNHRSKHSQ